MKRYVGLYGGPNMGVLPFLGVDFERRGYTPLFRRASVFTADQAERQFEMVVTFGLRGGAGLVGSTYQKMGIPVLVADSAHLARGKQHKVVVGTQHWIPPCECPPDRLEALGVDLKETERGDAIVLLGQKLGDSQHPFVQRREYEEFWRKVVRELRQVTRRRIVWRRHPLDHDYRLPGVDAYSDPATESLDDALSAAHTVVTYNSTAGLDALIAGVPVVAYGPCVYGELAESGVSSIDELQVPSLAERRALLARVAYTQWTVEECRDGACLDFLLAVLRGEDPFEGCEGVTTGSSAGGREDRGVAEEQGVSAGVFAPPLPPAVVSRLRDAGYVSPETVNRASDEELRERVKGLGPTRLRKLREYAA